MEKLIRMSIILLSSCLLASMPLMAKKVSRDKQAIFDIDVEIPQADINDVIKNPRQYALDFIELEFAKTIPKFIKAYKEGFAFGKKNK